MVFSTGVLSYYKSKAGDGSGVRMRLFFRQDEPELLRIPWEFMFDGTRFLSAYPKITMTKILKGIPGGKRERIKDRIRMLGVISSPLDLPEHQRLQIEREQMIIFQAVDLLYASNRIDIEFLDEASLRNIQDKLDEAEYHILHYTGHGVYSDAEDKGFLILEDDSGYTQHIDSERVANFLIISDKRQGQ